MTLAPLSENVALPLLRTVANNEYRSSLLHRLEGTLRTIGRGPGQEHRQTRRCCDGTAVAEV